MKYILPDTGECLGTRLATAKSSLGIASSLKSSSSSSVLVSRPCLDLSSVSITLSDSDGSDVEILPLADRIRGEGCGRSEEPPARRDLALSLTPAQMAGRAALRRMEKSSGEREVGTGVTMTHKKTGRRKRREEVGGTDDEDEEFPIFSQTSGARLQTNASSRSPVSPPPQATAKQEPAARGPVSHGAPPLPANTTAGAGSSSCSTDGVSTHRDPSPPSLPPASSQGGGQGSTDLGKPLFELKPGVAVGMGMGIWRYETCTAWQGNA